MDNSYQDIQFLDLDDLNKEEADEISTILYTARPTRSVFPWIQEQNTDWNQQSNYGEPYYEMQEQWHPYPDEGSELSADGSVPPGDVYNCGPPAVTTIQQQVYTPQVVQWMPAAPTASYGAPNPYYPQQERRPRTGKPSPKRQPVPPQPPHQQVSYPPLQHPYAPYMMSPQYQYMGPGMPSAQQAAGHPLYLTPMPVYPPGPMYPQYQQVYSPLERKDEVMPPGGPQGMPPPQPMPPTMPPVVLPPQPMPPHMAVPEPVVETNPVPVMAGNRMIHMGPPPMQHPVEEREPSPQPQMSPHSPPHMVQQQQQQPVHSPPQSIHSPPQSVQNHPSPMQSPPQSAPVQSSPPQSAPPKPAPPVHPAPPVQPQPPVSQVVQPLPQATQPPQRLQSPPQPAQPLPVQTPPSQAVPTHPLPVQSMVLPVRQPSPVPVTITNQVAEEPVRAATPEKPPHSAPLNAIRKTGFPTSTKSWAGLFSKGTPTVVSAPVPSAPMPAPAASAGPAPTSNMGAGDAQPGNPTPAESMTQQVKAARCKPPASALAILPPPSNMAADKCRPAFNSTPVNSSSSPSDKELAEMLSNYKLEGRATLLTPRGLSNPSNYCYVNATLQALLGCAPFYNLLRAAARFRPSPPPGRVPPTTTTPVLDSMVQFINEFSPSTHLKMCRKDKVLARKEEGEGSVLCGPTLEPTYVYKLLQTVPSFSQLEGRQQDAEEFLNVLLNGLNDELTELLKLVKPVALTNGEITTNGDTNHEVDSDWKEVTGTRGMRVTRRAEFGRSPLTDIFMGQLRSRVQRADPHLSTDNVQPFFCLPLDIENCDSVTEALERLVGRDVIEGSDSYQQQYLDHLPLILILHLKCFHYAESGPTKISKPIEVPVDLKLDTKYVTSKKVKLNYKLFAVTYHEGKEATKGHYVSDVYHLGNCAWVRYDDATVKTVTESTVMNPKPPRVPYLLYYRQNEKDLSQPKLPTPASHPSSKS